LTISVAGSDYVGGIILIRADTAWRYFIIATFRYGKKTMNMAGKAGYLSLFVRH